MIRVDEVSDGVFRVGFTGIDLRTLNLASHIAHVSCDEVLQTLLGFLLDSYIEGFLPERIQDELEGKDEGMGRG